MLRKIKGTRKYLTAFNRPAIFILTPPSFTSPGRCEPTWGIPIAGRNLVSCNIAPALVMSRHALRIFQMLSPMCGTDVLLIKPRGGCANQAKLCFFVVLWTAHNLSLLVLVDFELCVCFQESSSFDILKSPSPYVLHQTPTP